MSASLMRPLVALAIGLCGYVGAPVVAAVLGVATWDGTYDDSTLALVLFWSQMLFFAVAVIALVATAGAAWRRRPSRR